MSSVYRVIVEHPHGNFFRADGHRDGSSRRRRQMPMARRMIERRDGRRRTGGGLLLLQLDNRRRTGQHLHDVTVLARLVDAVGLMGQRARRRRRLRPHFPSTRSCCRSPTKKKSKFFSLFNFGPSIRVGHWMTIDCRFLPIDRSIPIHHFCPDDTPPGHPATPIDSLIKRSRESKCKCLNVVCFVLARHQ